jgi:hypothetical protein
MLETLQASRLARVREEVRRGVVLCRSELELVEYRQPDHVAGLAELMVVRMRR